MLFRLIEQILLCNLLQQDIHLQNNKRNAGLNDYSRKRNATCGKNLNRRIFWPDFMQSEIDPSGVEDVETGRLNKDGNLYLPFIIIIRSMVFDRGDCQ